MEDNSARVMVSGGSKQFQILKELSDLQIVPRETTLIVRYPERPLVEKVIKGNYVVHETPNWHDFSSGTLVCQSPGPRSNHPRV